MWCPIGQQAPTCPRRRVRRRRAVDGRFRGLVVHSRAVGGAVHRRSGGALRRRLPAHRIESDDVRRGCVFRMVGRRARRGCGAAVPARHGRKQRGLGAARGDARRAAGPASRGRAERRPLGRVAGAGRCATPTNAVRPRCGCGSNSGAPARSSIRSGAPRRCRTRAEAAGLERGARRVRCAPRCEACAACLPAPHTLRRYQAVFQQPDRLRDWRLRRRRRSCRLRRPDTAGCSRSPSAPAAAR